VRISHKQPVRVNEFCMNVIYMKFFKKNKQSTKTINRLINNVRNIESQFAIFETNNLLVNNAINIVNNNQP